MVTKKYILGFMILVVLSASVYFILPEKVRIDVEKTKTTLKVYENNSWILAGTEYTMIFDRTTGMLASFRNVTYIIDDNKVYVTRIAQFKDNITAYDYYEFDGDLSSVELYPVSHQIRVVNGNGKILQYEVNNLLYTEVTKNNLVSPLLFGHNIKIEWENKNYYSQIFKYKDKAVGKLTIKYKIDSNDYKVGVRLFDPVLKTTVFQSSQRIFEKGIEKEAESWYFINQSCKYYKENDTFVSCVQEINRTVALLPYDSTLKRLVYGGVEKVEIFNDGKIEKTVTFK